MSQPPPKGWILSKRDNQGEYLNLRKKAEMGDFSDLIAPLDYLILSHIPEEGEMFAGLYPITASSTDIAAKVKGLDATMVGTRFRMMSEMGLIKSVKAPRSSKVAYQRTTRGKEVYEKWQQSQK